MHRSIKNCRKLKKFGLEKLVAKSPVASLINAVEQKKYVPIKDFLDVVNQATESQLLMLKKANVITEEEYVALHQKILNQQKADQPANVPTSRDLSQAANSESPMLKWLKDHGNTLWPRVRIQEMRLDRTKALATLDQYVPPFSPQYQDAIAYLDAHPNARSFNVSVAPDGHVNIGEFTTTPQEYSLSVERGKHHHKQKRGYAQRSR